MKSGRLQICCAKPSSNGYVLTYPAETARQDVTKTLLALGISQDTITKSLATVAGFNSNEMLLVEQLDIPEDVLQKNGFIAL